MNLKSQSVYLCDFSQITFTCSKYKHKERNGNVQPERVLVRQIPFLSEGKADTHYLRLYLLHLKTVQDANYEVNSKCSVKLMN